MDRVDRTGAGEYEVIDYKTGQRVDTERLGGDVQLALYRLGAREAWDDCGIIVEAIWRLLYYLDAQLDLAALFEAGISLQKAP